MAAGRKQEPGMGTKAKTHRPCNWQPAIGQDPSRLQSRQSPTRHGKNRHYTMADIGMAANVDTHASFEGYPTGRRIIVAGIGFLPSTQRDC
jgi:hypothetical protein